MNKPKFVKITLVTCTVLCAVVSLSADTPVSDKRSLAEQAKAARQAWCSQPDTADGESHNWKVQSCKKCFSVQGIEVLQPPLDSSVDLSRVVGKEWKWQYQGRDYLTCQHEWRNGVRRTVPQTIANGQVVLVRKDGVYGAFVLTAQSLKPETAEFVWRYGTDTAGGFNTNDPNVKASDAPKSVQKRKGDLIIQFGPFEICWSRGGEGKGWIYYGKFPGDELAENDLAICVTDENSFNRIRPQDAKWQYRRSPVDGL